MLETFLDSTIPLDDEKTIYKGIFDNESHIKRGGVSINSVHHLLEELIFVKKINVL